MKTLLLALSIFYYVIFIEPILVLAFSKRVQLIVSALLLLLLIYPTYLLTAHYNFLFISVIMNVYPALLIILRLLKEKVFRENYKPLLFSFLSFLLVYLLVEERIYGSDIMSYPLLLLLFEIPIFVVIFTYDQQLTLMLLESYIASLIIVLMLPYVRPGSPTLDLFISTLIASVFIFVGKRAMKVKFAVIHVYFSLVLLIELVGYLFAYFYQLV